MESKIKLLNLATKMPTSHLTSECESVEQKSETASFEMISHHSSTYSLQSLHSSSNESEGVMVDKEKENEEKGKKVEDGNGNAKALQNDVMETSVHRPPQHTVLQDKQMEWKESANPPSYVHEIFAKPLPKLEMEIKNESISQGPSNMISASSNMQNTMSCTCPMKDHDDWTLQLQIDHLQAKVAWYQKQKEITKVSYSTATNPFSNIRSEESSMMVAQPLNNHSDHVMIQIVDEKTKNKWDNKNNEQLMCLDRQSPNIHLWVTKDVRKSEYCPHLETFFPSEYFECVVTPLRILLFYILMMHVFMLFLMSLRMF